MFERSRRRLHASIHLMSYRTALHEDDRVVTVLACDGCRQADYKSGFSLAYYLLETVRRQVMALVDNHMAVLGDTVIDYALSDETLNYGDVDVSSRRLRPPPIRPIDFAGISRNVDSRSTH